MWILKYRSRNNLTGQVLKSPYTQVGVDRQMLFTDIAAGYQEVDMNR